jgi:hypothetical protein
MKPVPSYKINARTKIQFNFCNLLNTTEYPMQYRLRVSGQPNRGGADRGDLSSAGTVAGSP